MIQLKKFYLFIIIFQYFQLIACNNQNKTNETFLIENNLFDKQLNQTYLNDSNKKIEINVTKILDRILKGYDKLVRPDYSGNFNL
jgi:hypothetical protein